MVRFRVTVLVDDYAGFTRGLLAEHGFSVAIEPLTRDSLILFDTGQSGIPLVRNAPPLGLDLKRVSTVILSHSHYDHSGGLPALRDLLDGKVSLVAHPDVVLPLVQYTERGVRYGLGLPYSEEDLRNAFNLCLASSLYQVESGIFFLGEVPRSDPDLVRGIKGTYSLKKWGCITACFPRGHSCYTRSWRLAFRDIWMQSQRHHEHRSSRYALAW